jgi:basic membrane protein A
VNGEKVGGGTTVFGLAEDGVGLGKVSPKVSQDLVAKVDAQKKKIIDGQITIPETVG